MGPLLGGGHDDITHRILDVGIRIRIAQASRQAPLQLGIRRGAGRMRAQVIAKQLF
jgi:hypothetical protein